MEEAVNKDKKLSQAIEWNENAFANRFVLKPMYWLIPIAIWSLIVTISLAYNIREINEFSSQTAANKGRFVFQMIEDMRLWNARHGGVYVDETISTPSNPFLDVPDKDIVTTEGRKLTKINPAYMTRQLAGVIRESSRTLVNITSLKPINPINIADKWETQALQSFESGIRETYAFLKVGENNLFRFMAPLITKQACLQCHSHQGYKVGDVRGGISISFDSTLYLSLNQQQKTNLYSLHAIVWLTFTALMLAALSLLRSQVQILITSNKHQEKIVTIRTQDLQEESKKRHELEARFRRFIDATEEGIVALDMNGICDFANPKAADILGLSRPTEIIGKIFHDLCGHSTISESICKDSCAILNCLKNGKAARHDTEFFKRNDGDSFPVDYSVSPVYDNDERIGVILTFRDISALKEQESQLKKLSAAVDHSPASTLITDNEGRIEYVNKRFTEITGYSKEEVIGKNPRILKSGHTDFETYQHMWNTIKEGFLWQGELFNRRKDGSLFWEESLISPIKDQYGNITHFVAVKRDITEYKLEMNEVWRQANYDALTNLPNRNLFEDRLENAVALATRENRMLALLFVDLDGFKDVNDAFGHNAGDYVLKVTANRLQDCLRHSDTAARLGGDEFVIILQDSHSVDDVENVATKVIELVAGPIKSENATMHVSASVGISMMPRDSVTASDLLRLADIAMYGAKQNGKNCFCHYADSITCKPTDQRIPER